MAEERLSILDLGGVQETLAELGRWIDQHGLDGLKSSNDVSIYEAIVASISNWFRGPEENKLVITRDEDGNAKIENVAPPVTNPVTGLPEDINLIDPEPQLADFQSGAVDENPFLSLSGLSLPTGFTYDAPPIRLQSSPDYLERKFGAGTDISIGGNRITPRYRAGDEWQDPYKTVGFATVGVELIADMQAKMVQAGVLDFSEIEPGVYGPNTAKAMQYLMARANTTTKYAVTGRRATIPGESGQVPATWEDMLDFLVANPVDLARGGGRGGGGAVFTPDTYTAPDYASVSQTVKSLFRETLRREPREWEMALLADQIAKDHRASFAVDEAARRSEFEVGQQAAAGAGRDDGYEEVAVPMPDGSTQIFQVPGGVSQGNHYVFAPKPPDRVDVDHEARLLERFEQLIAGERENREMSFDVRNNVQSVINSAAGLSNLIGGR